jgi:membrane protein implicated in regulation of membrane protease activity
VVWNDWARFNVLYSCGGDTRYEENTVFLTFLLVGLVGFVVMVLLSAFAGHGSSHGHGHGSNHGHGHGSSHTHGHGSSHTHHSSHGSEHHHGHHAEMANPWLQIMAWFSPRAIFTLCLGFGATGMALNGLSPWFSVLLALIGAIILEGLLVRPYWNALLGFASHPAQTLESLEGQTGYAITRFNANGEGLVRLLLDGQERQVLGRLEPLQIGKPVVVGTLLRILEVRDNGSVVVQKF